MMFPSLYRSIMRARIWVCLTPRLAFFALPRGPSAPGDYQGGPLSNPFPRPGALALHGWRPGPLSPEGRWAWIPVGVGRHWSLGPMQACPGAPMGGPEAARPQRCSHHRQPQKRWVTKGRDTTNSLYVMILDQKPNQTAPLHLYQPT